MTCCLHSVSDDIGVNLTSLKLLSEPVVPAFVPRLGDNKGLLPVRLRLSGPDYLPGAAAIQARACACFFAAVQFSEVWQNVLQSHCGHTC